MRASAGLPTGAATADLQIPKRATTDKNLIVAGLGPYTEVKVNQRKDWR
jgi:hypothetical protein